MVMRCDVCMSYFALIRVTHCICILVLPGFGKGKKRGLYQYESRKYTTAIKRALTGHRWPLLLWVRGSKSVITDHFLFSLLNFRYIPKDTPGVITTKD